MSGVPVSISTLLRAGYGINLRTSGGGKKYAADLMQSRARWVLTEYGDEPDHALGALERRIEEGQDEPATRTRERMAEHNAGKS